ncbi:MAG: hypothetical protein A2046_15390 [Bacteroidetes bacterium GWA2_30_7]|nr:MAG: hypothetical protein A2046_15390 [Bacteroidetes bacterium GWA2_30_7]
MKKKEFINLEKARANCFNIFTALFCQPQKEIIKANKIYDSLLSSIELISPKCIDYILDLKKQKSKINIEKLLIEYSRLFIGPFGMIAPPYSSMYFGQKNNLMSDETLWVINFYNDMGLEFDTKIKDAPDHIAIELEFIYYMIYKEISELENNKIKNAKHYWINQVSFYNNHFKKWTIEFSNKIENGTTFEFYKILAICFKQFLTDDKITAFPVSTKIKTTIAL